MAIQCILQQEKECPVECERKPDLIWFHENLADANPDDVALSDEASLFFRLWQQYEHDIYAPRLRGDELSQIHKQSAGCGRFAG